MSDGIVHSAGAQLILDALRERLALADALFSDGAYGSRTLLDAAAYLDFTIEQGRWFASLGRPSLHRICFP